MFAIAVALYLLATVVLQPVHVVGSSMSPSLADDDVVLASRIDYWFHAPARGDIAIVRDPGDRSKYFIKRVIGLPGDRVLIRAGHVYLNSVRLDEPYLSAEWILTTNWPAFPDQAGGEAVPAGDYFVLGDNRDHSSDSRLFGYVATDQIESRAVLRLWPLGNFEVLDLKPRLETPS